MPPPFSFSFSFNKKQLNPLFLPDSMLYEDTISNYPFQRTAYLVIYSNKSSYHAILSSHLYSFGSLILSVRESKNNSTKVQALYLTDLSQCWKRVLQWLIPDLTLQLPSQTVRHMFLVVLLNNILHHISQKRVKRKFGK